LVISDEIRGVYVHDWFPGIIAVRISHPLYEILELTPMPVPAVIDDCFHFKFFFSFGQVGWWTGEVWAVHSRFLIFG